MDEKLEVIVVPVSDVDRAKEFYTGLGWRLDADHAASDKFRIVQLTPPGSECSIQFGTGPYAGQARFRDANWPDWYARYMVAEQAGTELPT